MKNSIASIILGAAMMLAPVSINAAVLVDVILVVDESGSMSGEHAWLDGMAAALDTKLTNLGYTANFGLFGFGGGGAGNNGRTLLAGGNLAAFQTANNGLVTTGSTEDGYTGIKFASGNMTFSGGVRNYILVTDEDRDVTVAANTFATTAALLSGQSALLNAVVSNPFTCTGGGTGSVIGRTTGSGYRVNGSGGYTTCTSPVTGDGAGATETDYVPLATGSLGAAWNLDILRNGGNDAASFTSAFVDIKVQEIVNQNKVPEPSTFLVGGSALIGLALLRRRKN